MFDHTSICHAKKGVSWTCTTINTKLSSEEDTQLVGAATPTLALLRLVGKTAIDW